MKRIVIRCLMLQQSWRSDFSFNFLELSELETDKLAHNRNCVCWTGCPWRCNWNAASCSVLQQRATGDAEALRHEIQDSFC
jgi:hypothetical protein